MRVTNGKLVESTFVLWYTQSDEDDWDKTKTDCQSLGRELAHIRRRQRRLSGQVEDLEHTIEELLMEPLEREDIDKASIVVNAAFDWHSALILLLLYSSTTLRP